MSDNKNPANEEDFATLFEQSMTEIVDFKPGQMVESTIVSITDSRVFLGLGGKSEGQLDIAEVTDDDGNPTVSVGDTIRAYFASRDRGELMFTTRIRGGNAGSAALENAFANGIPVEGNVTKEVKGGFQIDVGGTRAFCPFSQMGTSRIEDPSDVVGKTFTFKIIEYGENGRNILVSNRAIIEAERAEKIADLKTEINVGSKVKGTVVKLQKFGAFVDIGGFEALLPISEISRSRVDKVSDVLKPGQEIEAEVISADWDRERISLSMKVLQADPWDDAAKRYPEGSVHTGTVARITKFGAFVTLEPGLDGLLHVSEFNTDSREVPEEDIPKEGREIRVMIGKVDTRQQRISLRAGDAAREAEERQEYMGSAEDEDTYNPFAKLLKDRKNQ
jgi:small subunit ribosomal protein S1